MKKVSLLALALSAVASSALFAETTPVVVAAPVAVSAAPCPATPCPCPKAFQGFAFGGNIGYGIGASQLSNSTTYVDIDGDVGANQTAFNSAVQGVDGGVLIGYAHRFGKGFLVGLDFYANWSNAKGSGNQNLAPSHDDDLIYLGVDTFTAKFKNSIDLRAVFGYVINDLVMPKFMLGWENAQWNVNVYQRSSIAGGATPKNFNKRLNGFLWGVGVDFLVAKNVVCGLEYTGVALESFSTKYSSVGVEDNGHTPSVTSSVTQIKPRAYNKFAMTLKFIY